MKISLEISSSSSHRGTGGSWKMKVGIRFSHLTMQSWLCLSCFTKWFCSLLVVKGFCSLGFPNLCAFPSSSFPSAASGFWQEGSVLLQSSLAGLRDRCCRQGGSPWSRSCWLAVPCQQLGSVGAMCRHHILEDKSWTVFQFRYSK